MQVGTVAKDDGMLGVGNRIARLPEMTRQARLANDIVGTIFKHGTLDSVDGDGTGEIGLDIWPYVGHESDVGLVDEEREFAGHGIYDL